MKKRTFDFIFIITIAILLIALNTLGLLKEYSQFVFIPFLAVYYIGQYAEKHFKN